MVGILKYVIASVFVCGWIYWLINVMWIDDIAEQRDGVLQQVAALKADPDTKQKKELLKIALTYEQNHTEILNWPFEIALEHFLADERKFKAQNFFDTTVKVRGLNDNSTLKKISRSGVGGVYFVPINIKISGGNSLSYTYLSQYIDSLLSTNQVLIDKLRLNGTTVDLQLNFLGTFPKN